jgi:hypothetical protein
MTSTAALARSKKNNVRSAPGPLRAQAGGFALLAEQDGGRDHDRHDEGNEAAEQQP